MNARKPLMKQQTYPISTGLTTAEIDTINSVSLAKLSQASREDNQYNGIFTKVMAMTQFIDDAFPDIAISFSLRIHCIKQGIVSVPVCTECGCTTSFKKNGAHFNVFCSDKCRIKNVKKLSTEITNTLMDYDWFYDKRITQQLSYADIGKLLGISEVPVRKHAKIHGLNKQKYNESSPFVKSKLRDKDWLFNEHVTNHRTCDDIATELGSSRATVSIWLSKHGIDANPSNSYAREHLTESTQESEIREYVESLGFTTESGNRTILNGYEIDVLVPDKKVGIEHHGLYSHAYRPHEVIFSKRKDAKYHRMKHQLATKQGYQLIQIFGDQWQYKQDIVKSVIASKLGATNKIYARKCEIVELMSGVKDVFLNINHLQGADSSSIRYGLQHDGEIVAVMTFNKTRYSKEFVWELTRYCGLKFHTVVGGFSKLLAHFRKTHIGSIVSYSDSMWSNGSAYEKNGFTLVKENSAGYFYVTPDKQHRIHRNNFRKASISDKGDTRTEEEIMFDNNYMKIFDAGNRVWAMQ